MKEIVISIEDGVIRHLVTEETKDLVTDNSVVRRASHVVPVNLLLRGLFHTLRKVFGEKGTVAGFTRLWPCKWRVDMRLSGGPILKETWYNRQSAIDAEILYLNENFI